MIDEYSDIITAKYNGNKSNANVIIDTVSSIVMLCIRHISKSFT